MPSEPILLLVDDDENILQALKRTLHNIDATIIDFNSPLKALEYCQLNQPSVIISDQHMPEMNGCEFLEKVMKRWPETQRIILSAYQDFNLVSAAFSAGIVEKFICKPWENKELKFIVEKALTKPIESHFSPVKEEEDTLTGLVNFHGIVAEDELMHEVFSSIKHASTTNAPIFVTGETGTGKELVAKACHFEGFHKDQPFVAVNCANFSEHLIESQLFGHVKGAFTGAINNQEGLFSAAKQGSLFLDEITTLSKPLQAKLLRVVQEREFTPLGTNSIQKFHAQIISASSNSIGNAVLEGEFREDLYYRLNVITIALPPLRERGSDLIHIARYFLKNHSKKENKSFRKFSRDALQLICTYDWPGNIRQLENIIHGMVVLNTGKEITAEMVIKSLSTTVSGFIKKRNNFTQTNNITRSPPASTPTNGEVIDNANIIPLWQVEKTAIESAILFCEGNIPRAASMLEVSPSTIYRKKLSW